MSKTVTVTQNDLVWHDDRCGMYLSTQGYVLLGYASGEARYMPVRQAKNFMNLHK